ncbi:hypothetical protein [Paludisphaera mucosa]|uniref:Cytosine permease n=1 Tax=Paludisphaera mucosa TaxID=3030827 RepID=A0ABT6F655_9BACT|nr:hypothetical protein [Paludisphaera mucosa]MDG3003002.1 hypothetical protein [Paludisphaera mucosa]
MTSPHPIDAAALELPPVVRDMLDAPLPRPHGWAATIAPAYLGVLAWFPLLDALGTAGGDAADVSGRYLSASLALVAVHALVYLPLAMVGLRVRRRLPVVAASAFGTQGAEWIAGVLYGLFAALWCSTAIWYSVRLTLAGLVSWKLLDAGFLDPWVVAGIRLESPLVLTALAFWTFIIASANGLGLMGAIAAMMRVYSPFAALLLVAAATWSCWIRAQALTFPAEAVTRPSWSGGLPEPRVFQLVFGAFAFAGLMAVEWGGAVRERRDVRLGGWVGILAAGAVTFLAALVLAAGGSDGSIQSALRFEGPGSMGPWVSGALLLLFGLASLAPACYASALFTRRCRGHWPTLRRWKGVFLGFALFFVPGATLLAGRIETIASLAGALFAPLAGVLAAELLRTRGRWAGMRPGWQVPGVAAWAFGVVIGLVPVVGEIAETPWLRSFQPAALFAYLGAGAAYLILAVLVPTPAIAVDPTAAAEGSP